MTTLAHTQTASGNEKQVTSGSVCKVDESELRDLLCRIDRRCPTARDASRMQAANMKTAQTSVR